MAVRELYRRFMSDACHAPEERTGGAGGRQVSFQAHVDLVHFFLAHRHDIVERIQGLLNAQRKPTAYLQDGLLLTRHFEDCFFTLDGLTPDRARLRGQLEEAHRANGFIPREIPGIHNGLIDPAEMMIRGFYLWQQTRWPGRNGRIRYAQTLFNLYVIRALELLSMRIWDDATGSARERLSHVQGALDGLWTIQPRDQPVLVRDARWLVQLAQSPATDDLGAYFRIAANIAETLSSDERIEVHTAGARMSGGHLRSQIRHYSIRRSVRFDDESLVLSTRNSNALDFALLIQDLVPLLEAYEHACQSHEETRIELASTICQGISPDPELFLSRVELLGAYSMLEELFVTTDRDRHVVATPMGIRHAQLIERYQTVLTRVLTPLLDDCVRFRPVAGAYSPYGLMYGFSSDLLEHMALRTLAPDAETRFSLEDAFTDGDADTLAWVSGWRKLPHLTADVVKQFEYPQRFAEDIFGRLERALRRRVSDVETKAVARAGRLFILPAENLPGDSETAQVPDLPIKYVGSSDRQLVTAQKADYRDETRLATERREGKCLVSYRTPGGWTAITKDVLTEVLGAGHDVKIVGLPPAAVSALKVMYPDLVVVPQNVPAR